MPKGGPGVPTRGGLAVMVRLLRCRLPGRADRHRRQLAEKADLVGAGRALIAVGRHREARAWFEKVAQNVPYDREVLAGLAEAAEASGEDELARTCRARLELLASPCPDAQGQQPVK